MSVSLVFGLPRAGKTTLLTKMAFDAVNKGKYNDVYSNVKISVPGVTVIDNSCIGKYALRNCLILIDEGTIFADSRSFKSFDAGKVNYFMLHGHFRADIVVFTQQATGVDLKIRQLTEHLIYLKKSKLFPWISMYYPVLYRTQPPKDEPGDIIEGYQEPGFLARLLSTRYIWRPRYYKYFDSYEEPKGFNELPAHYHVNSGCIGDKGYLNPREYEKALRKYKFRQFTENVHAAACRSRLWIRSIFTKTLDFQDRD